jgi:uncharacterized membrane protein
MWWFLLALVVVLVAAMLVIEVRSRAKKRREASGVSDLDKAEALLRLKQQYDRDEISDEEYILERTRLLSDE